MDQQLIFVHIPKTAGLALHEELQSIFGSEKSLRIGNEDELTYLRGLPLDEPLRYRYISGHFFFNDIKRRCEPDAVFLSVLRDPITRILSEYNYMSSWEDHPMHNEIKSHTFSDFVYKNADFFRGVLCRQLTSFVDAESALKVIESRYALLGTSKNLSSFVNRLGSLVDAQMRIEHTNVTPGQGKIDLDSALCECLLDITSEDRKLMAHIESLPNGLFERPALVAPNRAFDVRP